MTSTTVRRCTIARLASRLVWALLPLGAALAGQGTAARAATMSWATITYLSGGTAYLEVGTRQGIRENTPVEVVRADSVVARLTAKYVSSNRTACTIDSGGAPMVVGDSVRYLPAIEAVTANPSAPSTAAIVRRQIAPIRGRAGVRYLVLQQPDGSSLIQPALDLRLDGNHVDGTGFGITVDVRAQRTTISGGSSGIPSPASLTRVYQAAMIYQPVTSHARWSLGRQFATTLSPIGIFDGAALDLNATHWSAGALAGTQPDAVSLSPSGEITEYGVWLQRHNAPGTLSPWSATIGAIGSYDRGQINREFIYLHSMYTSRRVSLYAAEEVDVNRGWKFTVEGASLIPVSTFATAQLNLTDALSVTAGFDSRRSVRLYRDFVTPETGFDDAFRQGSWGEASLRVSSHLRISTDARVSDGGSEGGAHAITGSLFLNRLTRLQLGFRARSTQYTGPTSEGSLTSVEFEANPGNALRLSVNGGMRTNRNPGSSASAKQLTWTGADIDLAVGRSWYLMISTYRESGAPTASRQTFGGLSWRF